MKGRPEGSIIRNRLIAILQRVRTSYGYELYKLYKEIFGNVHIRTIYYNLKKGIEKEEIIVVNVARELGDYSWGDEVEKVYYSVGPYANQTLSKKDVEKINEIKNKENNIKIDWKKEVTNIVNQYRKEFNDYKERYEKLSNQGKKLLKQRLEEKYKKIKKYSSDKISENDLNTLIKDSNPQTL
ncbi:MAG: hypothetical protein JW791_02695 [Nanoarchaeota archaeon]|nr:hypothetical protein [Nanoarchaeota archaeon]